MSIFDKFDHLRHTYESFGSGSHNPFTVSFDRIESATEGVINGRRVILLGTNNYLGLTFDPHSIEEAVRAVQTRSEEHTSELQSLMRISYAVFCLKKTKKTKST